VKQQTVHTFCTQRHQFSPHPLTKSFIICCNITLPPTLRKRRDKAVSTANRVQAGQSKAQFPAQESYFIFSKMSRPVQGPTKPHLQWVPALFFNAVRLSVLKIRMKGTLPLLRLYAAMALTVTNSLLTVPRSSKWPVSLRLSDQTYIYIYISQFYLTGTVGKCIKTCHSLSSITVSLLIPHHMINFPSYYKYRIQDHHSH